MKLNIKFRLISDIRETGTTFFINWGTLEVEDVIVYLTKNGRGFIHEIVELTLLEAVLNAENGVEECDWDYCRSLFHEVAKIIHKTIKEPKKRK